VANTVHVLEIGRSVVRRRSRPLAGLPLAAVVNLEAHRKQAHQETPAERAQRLTESVTDIARHVLAIVSIITETGHD
jgi:hypothetical protein